MKKTNFLPLLAILLLFFAVPNYAQKNVETNVTTNTEGDTKTVNIIKKYIDENGVETIEETTRVITSDASNENLFYFNAESDELNDFNLEEITDIKSLSNLISEQLSDLEIDFNDENSFLFGRTNNKKSSCHSKPTPFLGVVTKSTANGALIQEIVAGSAAAAAGLKVGDEITSVAGQTTNGTAQLGAVIKNQKIGENVRINYIRNGQNKSTSAQLTTKNKKSSSSYWNNYSNNFQRGKKRSNNYRSYKVDPCKVFIGVYTSSRNHSNGEGLAVNGIIDNTPAQEAGLQKGDIIIAMDGVNVNTHKELMNQRETHEEGDQFTITYKRSGEYYTVGAEFKSCKQEETPIDNVLEERTETPQTFTQANTALDIELRAFPNPSNRLINIRFEGDAVPTTVSVTDINGKEVYSDYNRNFNGVYNEKVDLRELGAAQGTVIITVTQNGKATSKKLLYIQGRA